METRRGNEELLKMLQDGSHHAFLLLGEPLYLEKIVAKTLSVVLNSSAIIHPDVYFFREPQLSVEAARDLRERAFKKGVFGQGRYFVILSEQATREAQNALLKITEEPAPGTCFFWCRRSETGLLPTLLSRFSRLYFPTEEKKERAGRDFLSASFKERFKTIAVLLSEIDSGGREYLNHFLSDLETAVSEIKAELKIKSEAAAIVFAVSKFSSDPALAPRLILEHLALILPRIGPANNLA